MIRRRVAAHRWVYVAGRGLAEPSQRWTAFQLAMAGHLSLPTAVISHRTAAALHGFPDQPDHEPSCDVILAVHRRPGRAITPHFLRLASEDVQVSRSGLRITSPSRTAVDCLASLPFTSALDLWAWVSTRHVLDRLALEDAVAARRNWYGTAQLRRIAELVSSGAVSGAEFLLHQLLRQAGLTGWSANLPITDGAGVIGVADIVFLAERVIIEVDGYRAHSSRAAFVADRRRQNGLVGAGYVVLRFTWDDLVNRPAELIAQIRRALSRVA
jgi:very-short-patch-repair endonuclease